MSSPKRTAADQPRGAAGALAGARRAAPLRRWGPLVAVLLLTALAVQQGWYRQLTLEALIAHEAALRRFIETNLVGALAVYAAIYVGAVALSLPGGLLLTLSGGFLFGWLLAGTVAVFAATTGAAIVFIIARTSLAEPLAARAGPRLKSLGEGFRENALSYLLFLRLVPAFPFWLVNLAPALLGVRLSTFVIGTFIGIIPATFAFAFVGAGLDSVVDGQRASLEACRHAAAAEGLDPSAACELSLDPAALMTPGLIAALVALGFVALIPVVVKRLMGRRGLR